MRRATCSAFVSRESVSTPSFAPRRAHTRAERPLKPRCPARSLAGGHLGASVSPGVASFVFHYAFSSGRVRHGRPPDNVSSITSLEASVETEKAEALRGESEGRTAPLCLQ